MTRITRDVDAATLTAIALQHTQPVHLVRITINPEAPTFLYYSEGLEISFNGNTYLEGAVKVGALSWDGEGEQGCTIEILNEAGVAASLFFAEDFYNALVDIWTPTWT